MNRERERCLAGVEERRGEGGGRQTHRKSREAGRGGRGSSGQPLSWAEELVVLDWRRLGGVGKRKRRPVGSGVLVQSYWAFSLRK